MKIVVILGASPKDGRYSNIAQKILMEKGYNVFPVNPLYEGIEGIKCYSSIADVNELIDTVTVYLKPLYLEKMVDDIINKKPGRVIFNPGTEDINIENRLNKSGIETIHACTIVMLKTGQF